MWIYNPFNPPPTNTITTEMIRSPYSKLWNRASILINRFIVNVFYDTHVHFEVGSKREFIWPERTAIVANHSGYLDISLIVGIFPSNRFFTFLAKEELWNGFIGRLYYTSTSCVSVNREALEKSSIKSIKTIFKERGWVMALFPEGTRGDGESLLPLKGGAAYITTANQLDVIPVGIYRINKQIQVVVGAPLLYEQGITKEAQNQRIDEAMHQYFDEARARFYQRWPNASPTDRKRKPKI